MKVIAVHTIHRRPDPKKEVEVITPDTEFECDGEELTQFLATGAVRKPKVKQAAAAPAPAKPAAPLADTTKTDSPVVAPVVKQQDDKKWSVVQGDKVLVADLATKKAADEWLAANAEKPAENELV